MADPALRHLEEILNQYIDHNHARRHQAIGQRRSREPAEVLPLPTGRVERRDRLGGVSTSTARWPDETTEQGLTTHVHKATISVAVADDGVPPVLFGTIANDPVAVSKLVSQLKRGGKPRHEARLPRRVELRQREETQRDVVKRVDGGRAAAPA